MKFFSALKSAEFSAKLFAKVGFDFNAAEASADENALKAFIDSKAVAADAAQLETLNTALASATTENAAHLAAIADLKNSAAASAALGSQLSALSSSLTSCGVKIDLAALAGKPAADAEALVRTALETRVSTKARELVAATGGPLLDETPAADPTKAVVKSPTLTGIAAVQAAFAAKLPGRRN